MTTTLIRPDQVRGIVLTQAQADLLYAALAHEHPELLTEEQADLLYAALAHGHSELLTEEQADLLYAALAHGHSELLTQEQADLLYAALGHDHEFGGGLTQEQADLLYAALAHGHTELLTQAQADLLYAPLVHGHVEDDIVDLTHSAEALRDAWVADVAPQEGQVLQFVDDQWTPVTFSAGAGALDDLSDVAAASPSDGQVLAWNAAAQQWQPATVEGGGSSGGAGSLSALFDFQPEFAGAIIVPSAVQNGTLQLHDDVAARLNAYAWTSSAASEQSVEIVLRWRLPPGFDAWTTPLRVLSKVSQVLSVCAVQVVELLDTAGVNVVASTTRRNETWAEDSIAIIGGTWTPEGICTLRFRLYGKVGEVAYLGPVRLGYRVVFGE